MKFRMRGLAAAAVAGALALATMPGVAEATTTDIDYKITSPYASVDWDWAQYKAGFHNHTTESDGGNTARQMLEQAYALGFNVYAMTDHNFTNTTWDRTDTAKAQANPEYYLTTERMVEMNTGADRNGLPGMIGTGDSNEQSIKDHLNTFWTPGYLNPAGSTLESKIATVDAMTGMDGAFDPIMHINHPGRYYGGSNKKLGPNGEDLGALAALDPAKVARYVELFRQYPDSLVGMEIVNKVGDGDSYSDRIIVVDRNADSITIEGADYNTIEWIADGKVIATGNTLDLDDVSAKVDNYVRAQLKGDNGITFTNAFAVEMNVKSNEGRFLSDGQAAQAALASLGRTTGQFEVVRDFGGKSKVFVVTITTDAGTTTVKVDAETGAIL